MLRYSSLLAIGVTLLSTAVFAQVSPLGPSGDFRVDDRSGTAPTGGPAGGPSLPPGPAAFRDSLGGKTPDEILKNLNQDLGKSSFDRSGSMSEMRSIDLGRELQSPHDKFSK